MGDHLDKIMDDKCVRNDLLKPSGSRVAAIASEITTAGDDGCRLCSDWTRNLWGPECLELPEAHFFAPFLCFCTHHADCRPGGRSCWIRAARRVCALARRRAA